jgi:pilus assembly protein CpaB
MTVRVNDVVGVAGFALPVNFVDILINTQEEGAKNNASKDQTISKIVLERILVLAIAQVSSRDDTKPKVVNAVTLELTPDEGRGSSDSPLTMVRGRRPWTRDRRLTSN